MSTASDSTNSQNTGIGTLIAQVSSAGGAIPISGASVIISNSDGSVIETQFTDNSGRTSGINLPAPPFSASQAPADVKPYSTYHMRVAHPGYFTEDFRNISVFDRIVSIQPVTLEPLGEDSTENDRISSIDESTNS